MSARIVDPAGDRVVAEFAKRGLSLVADAGEGCPVCSSTTCEDEAHLPPVDGEPKARPRPVLRFRTARQLMGEPRPVPIIEGFAWAGCITVLVSESGAGKTFVLNGASAAVGDGCTWHGRAVYRGPVAYVSFEGDALGLRQRALVEAGYSMEDVHTLRATLPISPRVGHDGIEQPSVGEADLSEQLALLAAELAAAGKAPIVLVVVDTVRASLAGSEDSSEHASAYLRAVRRIMAPYPQAACILAHHSGWQDGEQKRKRERGSSAFRGNADATLYLESGDEDLEQRIAYLTLRTLKVRDDERPAPLRLIRRRVTVAELDERGEPRTTCIVERDDRRREDIEAEQAKAAAEARSELESRALDVIEKNDVPSIAILRALLGCGQPVAADLLARLQASGRIARTSQREPYRVVPSRTLAVPSRTRESYRTARPIGGTSTTRSKGAKKGSSRTGSEGRA